MTVIRFIFFFSALLILTTASCSQTKSNRIILGRSYAEQELKSTLSQNNQHNNLIDNKTIIIRDSLTAINVAEPILFSIYGKDNIIDQRPYEAYLIDHYWIISGTLPKGYSGGTFLIITDARDNRILKIIHGK